MAKNENRGERQFRIELLDDDKFVKTNNLQQIESPIVFNKFNQPHEKGLLSNEIFGITKVDRSQTYAYIDLVDDFISPACYKSWNRLDSKLTDCIYQNKTFIIEKGRLQEDPNGSNGIKWLKSNISKFKYEKTESSNRNNDINFFNMAVKDGTIWINKLIVIPPYYRDVATDAGRTSIGDINKLYNSLIISTKSLKESSDYGLTLNGALRGRIQSTIVEIYNWFGAEPQLGKKYGIIRRAVNSKTTDYGARLVMTEYNLKVEEMEDLVVDADHISAPLPALATAFFPYVMFHLRRFFENEFNGRLEHFDEKTGKSYRFKNYQIEFNDDRLKAEIDRFIHGRTNRFIPIEVPVENPPKGKSLYMRKKGYTITDKQLRIDLIRNKVRIEDIDYTKSCTEMNRDFTWCDAIYIATEEAIKDKHVLITRFPMDTKFNQFPAIPVISSTIETVPAIIDGKFYPRYPKIKQEDMGKDTSNSFDDSMNMSNMYLDSIGGDYDGDTCLVKGIYSKEANKELADQLDSPEHYIDTSGVSVIASTKQAIHVNWILTQEVPNMKTCEAPEF